MTTTMTKVMMIAEIHDKHYTFIGKSWRAKEYFTKYCAKYKLTLSISKLNKKDLQEYLNVPVDYDEDDVKYNKCWTCDDKCSTHKVFRDALNEYEFTCDECYENEYGDSDSDDDSDYDYSSQSDDSEEDDEEDTVPADIFTRWTLTNPSYLPEYQHLTINDDNKDRDCEDWEDFSELDDLKEKVKRITKSINDRDSCTLSDRKEYQVEIWTLASIGWDLSHSSLYNQEDGMAYRKELGLSENQIL